MIRSKISIVFATLTVVAYSGCASFDGRQDPAPMAFMPTNIRVIEKDNVSPFCINNRGTLGCVVRLRENNQCIIFVKAGLPYEVHGHVVVSESKHCFWNILDA